MRTIRERLASGQLLFGIVLAEAGVVLVGCGEWDLLQIGRPRLFYAMGSLLFLVGMFLIWKAPLSAMTVEEEATSSSALGGCETLGQIELNGIYFEAYEEETGHGGNRIRLQTFPPLGAEREAAFIRYLIHEGFIEKRWPRLSEKIQKEAGWAFFF
jgi:hypothetical protein